MGCVNSVKQACFLARHLPLAAMMLVDLMSLDFSDLIVAAVSPLANLAAFSDI